MIMMKRCLQYLIFTVTGFVFFIHTKAAVVDTVVTYSNSMKKNIKAVVVVPDNYKSSNTNLPVTYLLHGYSGNFADWVRQAKGFEKAADQYQMIIVCPNGNNSWYWDSPVDSNYKYDTYVSSELVSWIDSHYRTIKSRIGRGITGLSMGGHGGMYLGLKHQDVFGAAGSMSGGVDIRPFPRNWEMAQRLGTLAAKPENWEKYTVMNLLHLYQPGLAIIVDCGTEDFFYKVNEQLHQQLLYRNIPHDYITRPGAHNWDYWRNAVQYQLLFMNNFFKKNNPQ
jgi:S-formylglutathione hydrolase FrmB